MDSEVTPGRRFLLEAVDTGSRARAFLESALGRRLLERAELQRQDALEALAGTNPTSATDVMQAQMRVREIDCALRWFATMIEEAESALGELESQDDNDD